jgi:zinc transporter ZupT
MAFEITTLTVFVAAFITAVATGLGALPLVLGRRVNERWLSAGAAVAAGLMLAASHGLVGEGLNANAASTLVGMLIGAVVIHAARWRLDVAEAPGIGDLHGADARKVLLIMGVMTAHSFAEGVGVGVAYGGGHELGVFITTAIAVHNVPEGLAIALIMVPRGVGVLRAAGWAVVSSLPQPLMAVPAYLFVRVFEPVLPLGLGFAGGAMIWMIFAELLPDALQRLTSGMVGTVIVGAFLAMLAFQVAIHY